LAQLERPDPNSGVVVFFSDRNIDVYKTELSDEERHHRLEKFMLGLGKFYRSQIIVCKPHPLDKGVPIKEMELVDFQLCARSLLSQMYLQRNLEKVVACYSISSTSLLYSASIGIPSYSIFKYLGYSDDSNMKVFFNDASTKRSPFLYNLGAIDEIGRIDKLDIKPIKDNNAEIWSQLIYGNNS
jgi:hypothetical protein